MTLSPIKTAVVGVGLSGMVFHLPLLAVLPELFEIHTVVERNPRGDGGKARKFGVTPKVVSSIEEALNDPEVELVIIGTPNATHYSFAKAALLAGKHVLVDKPITPTYSQARELLDLANAKNLVLYAFQNRRWDSDFLTVKKLINDGTLGSITEFESHFDRFRTSLRVNWHTSDQPGSGLVYDLGTHLIDQALVLFGRPQTITAFLQNVAGLGDVEDNFTILLHYPSHSQKPHPLTVILRANCLSARNPQFRYSIKGTKGVFTKEGVDIQENQLKANTLPVLDPLFGIEPHDIHGLLEILQPDFTTVKTRRVHLLLHSEQGTYVSLYRNLAVAIRNDERPDVKWEEASTVIQLIELAKQSSMEGRTLEVPV
ncbi:NAD(P)-binding protein [Hysterangium stoloniferum]|nr:NAD(P)-binding protein [Hysterangium stoloniferum]